MQDDTKTGECDPYPMTEDNFILSTPDIVLDETPAFSLIDIEENAPSCYEEFCAEEKPFKELESVGIVEANATSTLAAANIQAFIYC